MRKAVILFASLCLAGCSQAPHSAVNEEVASYDITEAAPPQAADAAGQAPTAAAADSAASASPATAAISVPAARPRIAYVYEFGFRLATDRVAPIQRAHADLCEKQGPQVCRIIDMRQSGAEADYASGSLSLAVAAPRARAFGVELSRLVESEGGKGISEAISGEDLSKQMIDTEARLRARTLLRDRLMEVLATRKGTVAELVEAERGVAQVNEEIDQARSWLEEMQGRVAFSRVNIAYSSGSPAGGGFTAPIRGALGSIGGILGMTIAALIIGLTVLLPVALIVAAGWWGRRTWRSRRSVTPAEAPLDAT